MRGQAPAPKPEIEPVSSPRRSPGRRIVPFALLYAAANAHADDWPIHYTFADGTDVGLTGIYRWDVNDFANDTLPNGKAAFADAPTNRRKGFGFAVNKPGFYDVFVEYEFENRQWLDAYLRVQSKALLGDDYGAFRFGYTKTPVSLEGAQSTRANTFLELSLPAQAIFEGRRTGIDWAFERPAWLINLGYYWGQDLQGDNDGRTFGGRAAWTPRKSATGVIHLGVSASREERDTTTDGRGIVHPPSARIGTPPEAGLTPVRLVDSGTLSNVGHIDRSGLEGIWIGGPWSVQGETLWERVARYGGVPNYDARGAYVFGSWIVTGESRPYKGGNVGNIKPGRAWGAVELLLRYSTLDLNSGPVLGGKEHDWTLGANWLVSEHLKFQANYIRAWSDRGDLSLDPRIFEFRVQIYF